MKYLVGYFLCDVRLQTGLLDFRHQGQKIARPSAQETGLRQVAPLSSSFSFFSSSSIRSLTSSQRTSAGLGEFNKASNWREATCWVQFLFSGLPQESPGSLITYVHMKGLIFAFPYFDNHVYLSKRRAEAQCSIVVLTANIWAGRHPGRKFFHSFSRVQAKINTESLIFFVMNWQLICLNGRTC